MEKQTRFGPRPVPKSIVIQIRRRFNKREKGSALAREFDVSPATVSNIVNGRKPYDY
jgi:plasmid maintenance system antidote protein VapI